MLQNAISLARTLAEGACALGERAGRTNIQLPLRGTSVRGARGGGRGREEEGEEEEEEEEERSWKRWSNGVDRMTMW